MATPGSSFNPTPLGQEDNLGEWLTKGWENYFLHLYALKLAEAEKENMGKLRRSVKAISQDVKIILLIQGYLKAFITKPSNNVFLWPLIEEPQH
ncbi:hypothetical protein TNCV_682801 [Trichonephila clavipes]|nr:hypothetical protein TNCV_682801 [Trichonephila clavipes]